MSQAKTRSRDRRRDKRPENFLPLLPEYGLFPAHRSGWDGRAMPLPRNFLYAPVAQGIEHRIPNPGAAGSIPAWSTNKNKGLDEKSSPFFYKKLAQIDTCGKGVLRARGYFFDLAPLRHRGGVVLVLPVAVIVAAHESVVIPTAAPQADNGIAAGRAAELSPPDRSLRKGRGHGLPPTHTLPFRAIEALALITASRTLRMATAWSSHFGE